MDKTYSLNINDYASQWEYNVDAKSGVAYYALNIVYCTKPVVPEVQHMIIYTPESYMSKQADGTVVLNKNGKITNSFGVTYTADTAPIIYTNKSGGYTGGETQNVTIAYLEQGFVQVSAGARGKETQDAEGHFIGQFPLVVVDLKAGIRFLKANKGIVPGNPDRIVSHGYSSGGAMSTMLGASGNAKLFDKYLKEMGAAETSDDIFIALCYCPITNLDSSEAAFEWFQRANTEYTLFNAMGGGTWKLGENALGGTHEAKMVDMMYVWYVNYVRALGFDLGEDGRSGEYYTGLVECYERAFAEYMTRFDSLDYTQHESAEAYLEYLRQEKNADSWLKWDKETKTAKIAGLDEWISSCAVRHKMCPSMDSYNYKSNENGAFVKPDGARVHFSPLVRDMLGKLADEYPYAAELYEAYKKEVTPEAEAMLAVMSPVNYIIRDGAEWTSTHAPYFRFRNGGNDADHGFPAAWLTHNVLLSRTDVTSEIAIVWEHPHCAAEYDNQDLFAYINDVMAKTETK